MRYLGGWRLGLRCQAARFAWVIKQELMTMPLSFSTSTRNFDNRMGMGAKVYLGSAELAAVCALLGRFAKC